MTIELNVQAEVIDITTDTPQPDDSFLVDTNVWLWQTYSRFSAPQLSRSDFARFSDSNPQRARSEAENVQKKIAKYIPYIKKGRVAGAKIFYSGLILAELAHLIEKTEYEIYKNKNRQPLLTLKQYRHTLPNERGNVVAEVQSMWSQVEALGISADLTINGMATQAFLARLQTQALDGYDPFLLEAINQSVSGQIQVLTHDMDYVTANNIRVFTANGDALSEARKLGKLLVR
jgi:hypothetical protein